jgi:hypothetical protein
MFGGNKMKKELFDKLIEAGWKYAPDDCLINKDESVWVSWGDWENKYVMMSLTGYKILKFRKNINKDFDVITGVVPHTRKQKRKSTRRVLK